MFASLRHRATYANVVATIALILAISGGSAYALKGRNTVFSNDIAPNQVRGADAREGSFKTPRIFTFDDSATSSTAGDQLRAVAECPTGYSVTGGGFNLADDDIKIVVSQMFDSPTDAGTSWDSWQAIGNSTAGSQFLTAYAICERGTTKPPPT